MVGRLINIHSRSRLLFISSPSSPQAAAIKAPIRTFAQATAGSARKVQMSNFEKDQHINYQRIEDNLAIVRKRQVFSFGVSLYYILVI